MMGTVFALMFVGLAGVTWITDGSGSIEFLAMAILSNVWAAVAWLNKQRSA